MAGNRKLLPRLSSFEVWAIALGGIIGWGAFVMPGNLFLPTGGPMGTAIAMLIAGVVMLVIALNLHFMMNQYPEAGGAFVYAKNAFGSGHGYVCGWFLVLAYLSIIPQNATALAMVSRNLLGNVLEVGPSYMLAGYETYLTELLITALVLTIVILIAVRSTRIMGILQAVFASCIVVGTLIIVITIVGSPAVSPDKIQPAFNPEVSPLIGIVGVLVVAPWAFVGFDAVTQMGEDIRFSPRKMGAIMAIAIFIGAFVYISLNYSAVLVLPEGYADWHAYISDIPNLRGLEALPVFYAVSQTTGNAGMLVLTIAIVGAILTGVIGFTLATSRLLLAMARGRVLPEWFAAIHPTYHTPCNAIMTVFLVSLALSCLGRAVLGWLIDMSSAGASVAFLYTSLATLRYAKREKKFGWIVAGWFGAIMSVVFIVLLLVPIDALNSVLDLGSYVLLITWIVLGVNFFTPQYKSNSTQISQMPTDFDEEVSPHAYPSD